MPKGIIELLSIFLNSTLI